MTTAANRGKEAEDLVRAYLTKRSAKASTSFYRLPDARAGSRQATLADFLFFNKGTGYLLEVKQVDHEYRLPHNNFDTGQVARMRLFEQAGAVPIVLVYHTPIKLWRANFVCRFIYREGGSWDLRGQEAVTLDEAFISVNVEF